MKNNIFDFATSELSQDAFICWCVNWFNDNSKPKLREMAIELIKLFSDVDAISSVKVEKQFSRKVEIDEEKGQIKIDVLILVNNKFAIIVEDKTFSSEHSDQMNRYKKGLNVLIKNARPDDILYGVEKIRTVYFKTGFMYDEDKLVKADVILEREEIFKILSKYVGNSEIFDSFVENLKNSFEWYVKYGAYKGNKDSFWSWNIANHQIAQYRLMRDIFPEDLWVDKDSWIFRVRHGKNKDGRPWTHVRIFEKTYKETIDQYWFFWRIDTDSKGPYISLRLYEDFDNTEENKNRHKALYEKISEIVKDIISKTTDYEWTEVYPGYRGNYKESALVHFNLKEKLLSWDEEKDKFIRDVNEITNALIDAIDRLDY